VPSRKSRSKRVRVDRDEEEARASRVLAIVRGLGWSPRDIIGFAFATAATIAVLVNALFLQSGPHPAPIFRGGLLPVASAETTSTVVPTLPRPRPHDAAVVPAVIKTDTPAVVKIDAPPAAKPEAPAAGPRSPGEIIADIQRELGRRGFFEGAADGFYGPKTDMAVRDFERAAGLKSSAEPNEALLRTITRSNVRATKPVALGNAPVPPRTVPNPEPASKRIAAVQRALSDYGYAQIKPSGSVDAETKAAIEKFERERKLPITGQVSDRVVRELTSLTGRAFD
jgi:peptidoglycan hydrolase-like protein with peptidoglycan-binding domain